MATQGIIVAIGGIKHKFKPGTALSKIEAYFSKLGHASVVLTDSEGYAIVDDPVEPGEYVATASKPNEQKTDDADVFYCLHGPDEDIKSSSVDFVKVKRGSYVSVVRDAIQVKEKLNTGARHVKIFSLSGWEAEEPRKALAPTDIVPDDVSKENHLVVVVDEDLLARQKRKRPEDTHSAPVFHGQLATNPQAGDELGKGVCGKVVAVGEHGALKRFKKREVRIHELDMLRRLQKFPHFPKLLASQQPSKGILMKRYFQPPLDSSYECARACKDVFRALRQLWSMGLCHTDVKPDNVMYDRDSGKYILIDFSHVTPIGCARSYAKHHFVHPAFKGKTVPASVDADVYSFLGLASYWFNHD